MIICSTSMLLQLSLNLLESLRWERSIIQYPCLKTLKFLSCLVSQKIVLQNKSIFTVGLSLILLLFFRILCFTPSIHFRENSSQKSESQIENPFERSWVLSPGEQSQNEDMKMKIGSLVGNETEKNTCPNRNFCGIPLDLGVESQRKQ